MHRNRFAKFVFKVVPLVTILAFSPSLRAQGPSAEAPKPALEAAHPLITAPQPERPHKFLDKQNLALFSASAALAATDFAVTRANLQNNGRELNPIVRVFGNSTAGLAANFAGETASSIGLSYFFHRTGHHKLERAVSAINIGLSAGAVSYSLSHR